MEAEIANQQQQAVASVAMDPPMSPLRSHQQHLRPFDAERSPRSSEDGTRERQSPAELTQSRENSVHGPGGGAMHAMSPETQLSLYPLFFCEDRHEAAEVCLSSSAGTASTIQHAAEVSRWRMKERMKTTSVALVMCLNIGVDPPDVLKISPCARAECWINPLAMPPAKALEAIGKALQAQYERWQPRAKYKTQLDPTVEDVKKLCQSCRRNARNERVLLHYNGHGVPRPTANGEIWVFNKSYTQYIPLSVYDLQSWTGNPAIYVFDCGGAGVLVDAFLQLAQRGGLAKPSGAQTSARGQSGQSPVAAASGEAESPATDPPRWPTSNDAGGGDGSVDASESSAATRTFATSPSVAAVAARADATMGGAMPLGAGMSEVILLAACGADETLPQSAELPADVFSACLTTPIKIALQWFCTRSVLRRDGVDASLIDKIPGQQNNRKTPLGELNWIFTAVTDTIAWNALPRPLFQRLFRQDLLVASLFRNFLLAERVMRASNCAPVSCPAMPPTYQHPMWHAWDAAVETCLLQMPGLLNGDDGTGANGAGAAAEFAPSPFFTEQLTAFEVWLERGSARKPPPEQLPIVLQVLLSQSHRLRALVLLGRFLDMGPWAVDLALSVGIFPYVLKLLQTTAPDLRQILVFIWTKILALDASCQADLVKDGGHAYFARFLDAPDTPSEERAMAAFVLAAVCDGHPKGQAACAASGVAKICLARLAPAASVGPSGSPLLVRWLCLCLGKLWENARDAQSEAFASQAPDAVASLMGHPTPDARAAAVYALGALVYVPEEGESGADEPEPNPPRDRGRSSSVDGDGDGGEGGSPRADERAPESARTPNDAASVARSARAAAERAVACQILSGVTDASPSVRAETAAALGRLACAHARSFQAAAEAFAEPPPSERTHRWSSSRSSRDGGGSVGSRRFGSVGSMGALDEEAEDVGDRRQTLGARSERRADGAEVSPPSPARASGDAIHAGAFGSSTSLASAGSTGSLAGLSGSQGRNAGVYAASDLGPFEPAFGPGPAYRDPSVAPPESPDPGPAPTSSSANGQSRNDARVAGGSSATERASDGAVRTEKPSRGSIGDGDGDEGDNASAAETANCPPRYASADAARVCGGLYRHLLERLADLARDPSPRVAVTAQRALLATGLDPGHAPLRPVVGREAMRAVDGSGGSLDGSSPSATVERFGATRTGAPRASSSARDVSGDADVSGSDAFPGESFPGDFQFHRDVSDAPRAGASPFGHGGKSPSWHQKLSMAAARLLGSPGARGSAESVSSLAATAAGGGGGETGDSDMRRSSSARRISSPLSRGGGIAAMKRVATAHAPLRQMSGGSGGDNKGPSASSDSARLSPRASRALDPSTPPGVEAPGASSRAGAFTSASRAARRRRAVPASRAFARSREHFGRSLLEPPVGAQGHDGGYDDDDEAFGVGAEAPTHRRLDPEKRLARRRVAEERATRSARARRDQLRFTNPRVSTIETFANGAVPSAIALHPLTPTATVADTRGRVQTWDYDTGRRLHAFDAGLPGRVVANAGLVNDLDDAVLFTAGADGSVRFWRDYACPGQESLVAALRALPSSNASNSPGATASSRLPAPGAGRRGEGPSRVAASASVGDHRPRSRAAVVWQQQSGCLYASGDTRPVPLLRVWDMTRELCLESLQTQSPGTCLVAEGALLMAGALDGAVMSFDLRTPARLLSVVQTHRAPVVACLLQPGTVGNLVVTGAADGEMKFCDLRNAAKPFHVADAFRASAAAEARDGSGGEDARAETLTGHRRDARRTLTSLVAHDHARVIASGSTDRSVPVKLWDLEGVCFGAPNASGARNGKTVFRASGFGAPRCMAFHPNLVALGAGGGDGVASVWSAGEDRSAGAAAFYQR